MQKANDRHQLRSVVKGFIWFLVIQLILINTSASLHAYKFTHFYTDPALRIPKPSSKNIFIKTWKLFAGLKFPRSIVSEIPLFPVDTVKFKTADGLTIDGWYSKTDSAAKGTVILFHGLSGSKSVILPEASEFRYFGYNVMMVDLRGHGNSSGNTTTLGDKESEEVKLAYDYVAGKGEKNIFLWGMSLGAVIITKAINDYHIQPSGIMLEMPFASLQDHLKARSRIFGFPEQPFGFLVTLWVGIEQGYNGFKLKPSDYAKKINCPVLLQWGDHDRYVLPGETKDIFNNIGSRHKRLVIYEGADHESLLWRDAGKWRREITGFLQNPLAAGPV